MNGELASIHSQLIPYYRAWDLLEQDAEDNGCLPEPDPPASELVDELRRYVEQHPEEEAALEELLKVQLLSGNTAEGISALRRLIDLPAKRSPKKMFQWRAQLRNLEEPP